MTVISKLLQRATSLIAALPQQSTNGNSKLGTFGAPRFPPYISDGSNNGYGSPPWGGRTAQNSDPYYGDSGTGRTRNYDFTITRGTIAPDGYNVSAFLINGQYPGPTIEANWGDTISVTVHNAITGPEEGTALHYHGINQQGTPWMDGVPAVSMCPVVPGGSFTHTFAATPHGTTYYHSHYSSQWASGIWGPIVIHGPPSNDYDVDLGPVTINDYFHSPYFSILEDVMGTDLSKVRPASDNNLINGKGNFDCGSLPKDQCTSNAGLSKFQFTSGKKYLLRLINSGAQNIQKFSIDGHNLTVIANDFIPLKPYTTNIVTLGVGQRTDVIVLASGSPSEAYWMRSHMPSGACTEPSNQPDALAAIYYQNTTNSTIPQSTPQIDTTDPCTNTDLSLTEPAYPIPADLNPSVTLTMNVNVSVNATGHLVWTINESAFRGDYNHPILLLANQGNTSYPMDPEWNVYDVGTNATIRVVLVNHSPTSHPWHLHGHEMQVLASGTGTWDGSSIVRPSNPQRRDVHLLPANGYSVVQWSSTNAGVWPFHCHIAWHVSGGLYANILEQPAQIRGLKIPQASFDVCDAWGKYSAADGVNQIDSGLRMMG